MRVCDKCKKELEKERLEHCSLGEHELCQKCYREAREYLKKFIEEK